MATRAIEAWSPASRAARVKSLTPLALMVLLMLAIGGYTSSRSTAFLTTYNLNSLLLTALPLALVSMGQASALLVGGFDVSVGALVSMCVVVGSYTLRDGLAWYVLLPGALALVGVGLAVGLFNASLVRKVRLPSIIATLATLSILQGIALALRPTPAGSIDGNVMQSLVAGVGAVPYAFVGVVVLALAIDVWLYRTPGGLKARAVGFDEGSTDRLGVSAAWVHWRAFVLASLLAAGGAYFVAAQVGVGDSGVGSSYTLQSIAAAVLGGSSLAGGRGSFFGAVVGSVFLSLIINILPLLGWGSDVAQISIGTLTLLALVLYQGGPLWRRSVTALRAARRSAAASATAAVGK
jgi:ribose transport system ATP-binding protein